jgi:hypothetical protein
VIFYQTFAETKALLFQKDIYGGRNHPTIPVKYYDPKYLNPVTLQSQILIGTTFKVENKMVE